VRIGFVVGLVAEGRIAQRLGWPVAVGGGTAAGAEDAAERLVAGGSSALISFGLAGGLDPALRPGALIVPSGVIANGERYLASPDLVRLLGGSTAHLILGADTVVASVAEKRRLREQTGAAAVDIESGPVARVAARHVMPFAVVRAICDPAERALPQAALAALGTRGGIVIWRVLASIAGNPRQLAALLALAADASAARRSLLGCIRRLARASV
jgi:adenosylhomocysteine nucleosidase